MDRELVTEFDPNHFESVARLDPDNDWTDIGLLSRWAQTVRVAALGLDAWFGRGKTARNRVSPKFDTAGLTDELAAVSLEVAASHHNPDRGFVVSLLVVR